MYVSVESLPTPIGRWLRNSDAGDLVGTGEFEERAGVTWLTGLALAPSPKGVASKLQGSDAFALRHLTLTLPAQASLAALELPHLRKLDITHLARIDTRILEWTGKHTDLEELRLTPLEVSSIDALGSLTKIRCLSLNAWRNDLAEFPLFPRLTCLSLKGHNISDTCSRDLAALTELRELELSSNEVDYDSLTQLQSLTKLTMQFFGWDSRVTPQWFGAFTQLRKLMVLCPNNALGQRSNYRTLTDLEQLNIVVDPPPGPP